MVSKEVEKLLLKVQKPGRYVGGELNEVIKDKKKVDCRFAFCFPDTYDRIFRADGRCRTEAPAGTSTCRGRDIVDCRRRTAGGGSCGVSRIRPAREYKTAALRGRGRGALTGRFGRVRMTRRGVPGGTPLVYL